ncbi:telomerase Cajal body protein 1 [Onychostruthus taczanowskii]|uniref:telomerase Cajal body protein 1 n=1 Tax=Onychostruthus taczanowskii TaxID=356909 RepID=UPI001B80348A|nr:telomerase Cajal body protein 1 [Onychostruthus taczanowskii]
MCVDTEGAWTTKGRGLALSWRRPQWTVRVRGAGGFGVFLGFMGGFFWFFGGICGRGRGSDLSPPPAAPQGVPDPPGPPQDAAAEEPEEELDFPQYELGRPPRQVWGAREEFARRPENFLRGCKWVTRGHSGSLWPQLPAVRVAEGDTIYDFTWYPLMDSSDPPSCLVEREGGNGQRGLIGCLAFSPSQSLFACGSYDGRGLTFVSTPSEGGNGQRGLIGCLAFSPSQSLFACGSYGRSLGLYPLEGGGAVALWPRLPAAPTHLLFSPCGTQLYAGGRKDRHILCWDLRVPERPLLALPRRVATNQRVTFDLDPSGRFLVSGDTDGFVTVWDTLAPPGPGDPPELPPLLRFRALRDCVNGTSLHPGLPLLATASGQRLFAAPWDSDGDSEGTEEGPAPGGDIRLQLWWWGPEDSGDGGWDTPGDTGDITDSGWDTPGDSRTGHCHHPGDTECHLPGDTATGHCHRPGDTECHLPGDTKTDNCHIPGDTECHLPGDTATGNCHHPGDTECHIPGDTGIGDCHIRGDTECHFSGNTETGNCHHPGDNECHLPGDIGTTECHLPGDTVNH